MQIRKYFASILILTLLANICAPAAVAAGWQFGGLRLDVAKVTVAGTTTTLTNTSKQVQVFSGTGAQTVAMPAANTLKTGYWYELVNQATGIISVNDGAGTPIASLAAGRAAKFFLISDLDVPGSWSVVSGGGGESSGVTRSVTQTAHGFAKGQWIRHDGTAYVLAQADTDANSEVYGIVSAVADANSFTIQSAGYITGLSGLTAGSAYFLSATAAGTMAATAPTTTGQVSKPVFLADSTTSGFVIQSRGIVINPAASGGGFTSPATTKGDTIGYSGTVSGRIPVPANGQALMADQTATYGFSPDYMASLDEARIAISATAASSTINLSSTFLDGTAPIFNKPTFIAFRSLTATDGAVTFKSVGQATLAIPMGAGATLGLSGSTGTLYVYGTYRNGFNSVDLAVSASQFAEDKLVTTTAISSSSTDPTVLYAPAANASTPVRYLGKIQVAYVGGAWTVTNVYSGTSRTNAAAQINVMGTEWASYTPTFQGLGTPTNVNVQWMQSGSGLKLRGTFNSGTMVTAEVRIGLPTGYSTPSTLPASSVAGVWTRGGTQSNKGGLVLAAPSATYVNISASTFFSGGSTDTLAKAASNQTISDGETLSFEAEVPVAQLQGKLSASVITKDPFSWLTSKLTTRVTTTPSKLGEYRTYGKTAGSTAVVDGVPSIAPGTTNGIYVVGAVRSSGFAGGDVRHEFFVEDCNKVGPIVAYGNSGRAPVLDTGHFYYGTTSESGVVKSCVNNVLTLDWQAGDAAVTSRSIGSGVLSNGGSLLSYSTGYYDVQLLDNPLGVGISPSENEVTVWGQSGHGSVGLNVPTFTTLQVSKGGAATYVSDSVNGDYFLINEDGYYTASFSIYSNGGTQDVGITLDSASLTVPPNSLSYAQGNRGHTRIASGNQQSFSRTFVARRGQKVRVQDQRLTMDTGTFVQFTITKAPYLDGQFGGAGGTSGPIVGIARIANNGTCSVTSQVGTGGLPWISSLSHPGLARCALVFTPGFFPGSIPPICAVQGDGNSAFLGVNDVPETNSGATIGIKDSSSQTYTQDFPMKVVCTLPR